MAHTGSPRTEQICCCDQCVGSVQLRPQNGRFGQPLAPKFGALANNSSLLWRSRSFAEGLTLGQTPITSTPAEKSHKSVLLGNNFNFESHPFTNADVSFGQQSVASNNSFNGNHHLSHDHHNHQQNGKSFNNNSHNTIVANTTTNNNNNNSRVAHLADEPLSARLNRHSSTASDDSWVMAATRTAANGFHPNMICNNQNSGNHTSSSSTGPLSNVYTVNNNGNNNNNNNIINNNGASVVARAGSLNSSQNSAHHSSRTGSQCSNDQPSSSSCNTPGDVSLTNGMSAMRHSQSDHSYLSAKARTPLSTINPLSSGNIINPQATLDASSLSSLGSSASGSLSRNSTMLNANNHRYSSLGNLSSKSLFSGLTLSSKNLRTPTPDRSLTLFLAIEKGLRECIALTQNDIVQLKNSIEDNLSMTSAQGRVYELEKQCKTAERYLKRLEFQLAKVEELRDQYEMHVKMSQGVNSMVYAYSLVPGKEKELAVSSARSELKDCMQHLLQLEQQLEQQMLGTLRLQMQGIQGFARLCAGDQFEITIRCGTKQKWKCRGKILKDNVQSWDCSEQLFRPGLHEPLIIRAVELRGLTKKICLGEKQCELRHLLAARPQLMSICLNPTGTLKLHLIATWNPLHTPATDVNGKSATLGSSVSGLTKSKSFLGSSTSLLARWTGSTGAHQQGTLSHNYSGLSKSLSSYNVGNVMMNNNTLGNGGGGSHMGTLSGGSIASGQMEILDVDYYHHPHLFNGSETGARLARQSSGLSERLRPIRPHSYHPSNGGPCLTPIPSPTPGSPCPEESSPRALSPDIGTLSSSGTGEHDSRADSHTDSISCVDPLTTNTSGHHSSANLNTNSSNNNVMDGNNVSVPQQLAGTPSSTGSRGSSIHLTGTSSSGFGSSSSYCGSSMPNSTLTSPDCESPPATTGYCDHHHSHHQQQQQQQQLHSQPHDHHHCSKPSTSGNNKEILVQATVHPEPPMEMPRSCSMPAALTSSNALTATAPRQTGASSSSSSTTSSDMTEQHLNGHSNQANSTQSLPPLPPPAQLFFNVTDTLINLISALEDIQGQYSELDSLHQHVLDLYRLCAQMGKLRAAHTSLQQACVSTNSTVARSTTATNGGKNRIRRKSDASEISISVESALECFDFLNQVTTDSDSSPEHELHNNNNSTSESLRSVRASKAAFAAGRPVPPNRSSSIRDNTEQQFSPNYTDTTSITSSIDDHHQHHNQHHNHQTNGSNGDDGQSVNGQANGGTDECNSAEGGTGSEQLDIALMSHLTYCQRLLENLGAFGPLRSRERHSLDKLRAQSQPLATLVRLCVNARDHLQFTLQLRQDYMAQPSTIETEQRFDNQLRTAFHRLQTAQRAELYVQTSADTRVSRLWQLVCAMHANPNAFGGSPPGMNITSQPFEDQLLCVTSAGFVWALAQFARVHALRSGSTFQPPLAWLSDEDDHLLSTCQLITQRLLDAPTFETDYVVTALQVRLYLTEEGASVEHLLRAHAQEAQLLDVLNSGDPLAVKGALRKFKRTLPPREPLFALSLLLLRPDQLLISVVQQHFVQAATNNSLRTAMIEQFAEALENDSPAVRQAACLVLLILGAHDCLEQLAFICCSDTVSEVRQSARQTLLAAGPRGRQLYEESQLFTNGFQGLTVK